MKYISVKFLQLQGAVDMKNGRPHRGRAFYAELKRRCVCMGRASMNVLSVLVRAAIT